MSASPATARADDPVPARLAQVGRSPALVIAEGALGTVLGVLVLAWPGPTATVLAALLGINLLVAGVLQFVAAFSDAGRAGGRALSCVLGTVSLLVGLLCLRDPLQTVAVLGLLVGVAWTVGGVIRVVQGFVAERGAARIWRVAAGAVWVVAGAVVLVYPSASIVVLTSVLGIVLIADGACLIAAGFTMRLGQSGNVPAVAPVPRPALPRPAVPPAARL